MNEKVLTVVVPSYNVEAYLADTLKSFIHPDIMGDVEVLIVNDESTDSTEEIGRSFEVRYPQTFRVIKTAAMVRRSTGGFRKLPEDILRSLTVMTGWIRKISENW